MRLPHSGQQLGISYMLVGKQASATSSEEALKEQGSRCSACMRDSKLEMSKPCTWMSSGTGRTPAHNALTVVGEETNAIGHCACEYGCTEDDNGTTHTMSHQSSRRIPCCSCVMVSGITAFCHSKFTALHDMRNGVEQLRARPAGS